MEWLYGISRMGDISILIQALAFICSLRKVYMALVLQEIVPPANTTKKEDHVVSMLRVTDGNTDRRDSPVVCLTRDACR